LFSKTWYWEGDKEPVYAVSADGLCRVVTPKARLTRNSQLCFTKYELPPVPLEEEVRENKRWDEQGLWADQAPAQ